MKFLLLFTLFALVSEPGFADSKKSHHHKKNYHKYSHKYKGHIHKKSCGHNTPGQSVCSENELLINGDFEDDAITNSSDWQLFTSLTGWETSWVNSGTCNSAPLVELQSFESEQYLDSNQYIELDSDCLTSGPKTTNIEISQSIPAQVGDVLTLSFNYKPRMLNNGKMELSVKFGYNKFSIYHFNNTEWKTFSQQYTVKSKDLQNGEINLSMKDSGDANTYGMFVDNVSVKSKSCSVVPQMCTSASQVVSYSPIGVIAANRKSSTESLGLPNGEPVVEPNVKFTSLGFGGQIVLKLDAPVKNVVGPDLRVFEVTGGNQNNYDYNEEADVYASLDGVTWNLLGRVFNDNDNPSLGQVDLGSMETALYIKIVDRSPVIAGRDGFDIDAVTCVNQNNEFSGQFYYIDNTYKKIYKGAVEGDKVFTKEIMDSPYSRAHIDQNSGTLVVVEAKGQKRFTEIDISSEQVVSQGSLNFKGSLTAVSINSNYLFVNKAGTNKIYGQELGTNVTEYVGEVMIDGKPLQLKGGDITHDLASTMYIVTQKNKGSLYVVEYDFVTGKFQARLIAQNLGKVSGVTESNFGEMLVSIRKSTVMKIVNVYTGSVREVKLKGDLTKQGQGGDLAGFDSL